MFVTWLKHTQATRTRCLPVLGCLPCAARAGSTGSWLRFGDSFGTASRSVMRRRRCWRCCSRSATTDICRPTPTWKSYNQNCPIARGLDVLGERWTLLILRELVGGARRYSDLRAELPGIATNLLADRLRELEESGLFDRTELPPPVARTVYSLSEAGWPMVPPVVQAIATFGLDMVEPTESALMPLNGLLAGILLAFDRAVDLEASYRVDTTAAGSSSPCTTAA
jgi:DNA-binding HxlR family transcriptional regulator